MININKKDFESRKADGNRFSIISEFSGDETTPIRLFNGLKGSGKFLLESGSRENFFGRYSFLGSNPYMEICGEDRETLDKLKVEVGHSYNNDSNPFPFKGGAIGHISYEAIKVVENKLNFNNFDDLKVPKIRFYLYKDYICYDHYTHKIFIITNVLDKDNREYDEILNSHNKLYKDLNNVDKAKEYEVHKSDAKYKYSCTKEEYIENVEKAKDYILKGDIFQVVLSQRVTLETKKSGLEIYRKLRTSNPSPYMFYIEFSDYELIGSSPESLVALMGKRVITNPIAGTRKRGENEEEDRLLMEDLLNDEKEKAEHVMLVDLGRNDIGKVSKIGTVEVEGFMQVEKFSHVMHITSTVSGEIEDGKDAFSALESCLPAGTVSGAPKIRAMEIIEELENVKRGIYAGSVGYFSYGGSMDMSIAIRTMILKDKIAYMQAGAGIVYDSVPEKEYEETLNKLKVLMEAVR
ncbi:MAG: anthranilate synthase component I [Clostridium sp.]